MPVILARELPFRIGEAEFRPATREVLFDGQTAIIEPRVMQTLVALHRADGAVVTKDDLAMSCWHGRIVGEDAINRVISRLRSVGERQAGGQFRLETITKVGYRLLPAGGTGRISAAQTSLLRRRELMIGGGAVGIAAAGLGWAVLRRGKMPRNARILVDDARNSLYQATAEQTASAVGKLRRATELAPDSAEAWGLLALAYASSTFSTPPDQRSNILARAGEARKRAFALEPGQPDALSAGLFGMPVFRNWYNFEQAGRTALRRHPHHPVLQVQLGNLLMQVGRYREALPLYESSLQQTPLCAPSHISRIGILWNLGRFDEADAAVDRAFELMPGQYGIWFTKLYYLMYNGRARDAAAMVEDAATRPMGIPDWNYDLVIQAAEAVASGDRAAVRAAESSWSGAAAKGTGFTENAEIFAAFAGDLDEAFRMLGAYYFNRGFVMPDTYFSKDQRLYMGRVRNTYFLFQRMNAMMRRDPRFAILTRDLGLDDYWRRTISRSLIVA